MAVCAEAARAAAEYNSEQALEIQRDELKAQGCDPQSNQADALNHGEVPAELRPLQPQ